MIRINLLGIPKTKRGKRAAAVSTPSEGPSSLFLGLIMFLLVGVGLGLLYYRARNDHVELEKGLQKAILENQRLSEVKAIHDRTQKESDEFQRRVRVIDQLQAARSGPVDFLNQVANTINNTDAVWLQAVTDDGRNVSFTGMALSPNAVADLMVNLQKTGLFKTVEFKETTQDGTVKEMQAFKFELVCEKVQPQAQPPAQPQTQPKADKKSQA